VSVPLSIPLFKVFMPERAHAMLQPVLLSGRLACGPQVAAFETQCAAWLGQAEAVALNDATSALMLALFTAGVRPGDEVIVPGSSMFGIDHANCQPVRHPRLVRR
jgi:perosamine synthetase